MMSKKAYVTTLSTEKYLEGVLALKKGLDNVKAKYPLYVIVNENIGIDTEKVIKEYNIKVIHKSSILIPDSMRERNREFAKDRWNYTFDKLNVFSLTQFEKIVFLDSDLYIRKNIDILFEKENMSAVIDKYEEMDISENWIKLTSGVMVITPETNMTEKLKKIMLRMAKERKVIGDQDILQEYDLEWENKKQLHLDNKYNVFFPYLDYYTSYNKENIDDIHVFHFIYPKKPWFFTGEKEREEYLEYINDFTKRDIDSEKGKELEKYIFYNDNESKKKILQEYYKILRYIRSNK